MLFVRRLHSATSDILLLCSLSQKHFPGCLAKKFHTGFSQKEAQASYLKAEGRENTCFFLFLLSSVEDTALSSVEDTASSLLWLPDLLDGHIVASLHQVSVTLSFLVPPFFNGSGFLFC